MRIAVPHHTSKAIARRKIDEKIAQLLGQFGGQADELEHEWTGDTLRFKGKARGLTVSGTVEITDATVIVEGKLPLIAKPFEGRIRQAVESETEKIFRTA